MISELLIYYVIETHKSIKFTPGFIKKKIAEQEALLKIERKQQLLEAQAREAAANEAAEKEAFEREID